MCFASADVLRGCGAILRSVVYVFAVEELKAVDFPLTNFGILFMIPKILDA